MLVLILNRAGAFGAHALKGFPARVSDPIKTWATGSQYHLIHSGVLLLVPFCKRPNLAGTVLSMGMLLFSGSLYALVLTGNRMFGPITPIGGILMVIGWLLLLL